MRPGSMREHGMRTAKLKNVKMLWISEESIQYKSRRRLMKAHITATVNKGNEYTEKSRFGEVRTIFHRMRNVYKDAAIFLGYMMRGESKFVLLQNIMQDDIKKKQRKKTRKIQIT